MEPAGSHHDTADDGTGLDEQTSMEADANTTSITSYTARYALMGYSVASVVIIVVDEADADAHSLREELPAASEPKVNIK